MHQILLEPYAALWASIVGPSGLDTSFPGYNNPPPDVGGARTNTVPSSS